MLVHKDYVLSISDYAKIADNNCNYRIAIPSYKRAETLKNKTLKYLKECNIDSQLIDIFVADEHERIIYESVLPAGAYGNIIVGVRGMMNIRNFIQSYYNEGDKVMCFDDDIEKLSALDSRKKLYDYYDLNSMINYGFSLCNELGSMYFGIYAAYNPFYMSNDVSCGLYYLIGSCWGMIVNHDQQTYVTMDDKEDFERSIRAYLKYGNVVRLNFISAKSNYYGEKGGMQEERTEQRVIESGIRLMRMFPNQTQKNNLRKKHFEVRLVEQRELYKKHSRRKLKII